MNDGYILWCLRVPIIMIVLLMAMICFHRRSVLQYLYLVDMFCYLVAIFSYFIFTKHIVRKAFLTHWMDTPTHLSNWNIRRLFSFYCVGKRLYYGTRTKT